MIKSDAMVKRFAVSVREQKGDTIRKVKLVDHYIDELKGQLKILSKVRRKELK